MQAVKGRSMEKWLCWGSIATSGILLLLFALDLFLQIPFGRISVFVDVVVVLASAVILYLGWNAMRDLP
jgi:hypothetical protein